MKIRIQNVRLAFPNLFNATKVGDDDKPAFSASFLLPKDHPQIAEINAAIDQVAKDKWGAKADAQLKAMRAADKTALHNGDLKAQYSGFEGMLYISARNPVRPTTLNRDKSPVTESDGIIYAGCYVNAVLEIWAQDNKYGKRVNATLSGVQFNRDGDAFTGGGAASEDDFDDLEVGADAEELV
ncbi:Protein of unknown function DUF2815 [uncultured Caudovirales phage]|uniref:DUF2815 family protein n=1 Tax=uncultured Caudovirales phage TaxID=2100421 RepID=A0A6J5P7X3_9CAUD|nr:Protein of unknown function DUF2815 [uncultured Caudovirales phage]